MDVIKDDMLWTVALYSIGLAFCAVVALIIATVASRVRRRRGHTWGKSKFFKEAGLVADALGATAVLLAVLPGSPLHGRLEELRIERALDRCWNQDGETALSGCETVLSSDTSSYGRAEIYMSMGLTLRRMKRHDDAADAFGEAVRLQPQHTMARAYHAFSLLSAERFEEGLTFCQEWIRQGLYMADDLGQWCVGSSLSGLGRLEEAADAYYAFVEGRPDSVHGYRRLAEMLLQLDRVEEALEALRAAVRLDPADSLDVRQLLIETLREQGHEAEAESLTLESETN
jgi:tetratricopeptide (TPR) repeat protein